MNILVLSTFDITPARDGGQTRYVNLYSQVSKKHKITVLAYDFKQKVNRTYFLNNNFKIIAPACSTGDRSHFFALVEQTNRHLHDVLCIRDYKFSAEMYEALQFEASRADVVVAAHPYLAFLAFGFCPERTVKIYESFNVEYDAKVSYFTDSNASTQVLDRLLGDVWQAERLAAAEAHYVTAVSEADANRITELYHIPRRKTTVIPNGVDTARYRILSADEKHAVRIQLGATDDSLAVFIGSAYPPNVDAYLRTRAMLAQAGYTGVVVIIGSVKDGLWPVLPEVPFEERMLGFTDETVKTAIVSAADFALQLLFGGGGTNLKVFEYMASRTLIAANAFGRRGIPFEGWFWSVETAEDFRRFLAEEPWRKRDGKELVQRSRQIAEEHYDWRRIAATYDRLITQGGALLGSGSTGDLADEGIASPPPPRTRRRRLRDAE